MGYRDWDDFEAKQKEREKVKTIESVSNVVKTVGPNGGFKYIEFDQVEYGYKFHKHISDWYSSEIWMKKFSEYGIPVKVVKLNKRAGTRSVKHEIPNFG